MSVYQDATIAGFADRSHAHGNSAGLRGHGCRAQRDLTSQFTGLEMRGTANCTVVISDDVVGSPIIRSPLSLIVMNGPSLTSFSPACRTAGLP